MPELSIELRNQIYSIHGIITVFVSILLCICYGKKFRFNTVQAVVISVVWQQMVFGLVSQLWTRLDGMLLGYSSISAFRSILLLPPVAWVLAKIFKTRTLRICDYVTPFFFFCHGFATIACWICGCCAGCEFPIGIVSPQSGLTVFPTQPFNILFCMLTFVVTLRYAKKHDYDTKGRTYAIGMILYGVLRYALELVSDDPRLFYVLSLYSVCAIVMVLSGLLLFYFIDNPIKSHISRLTP